MVSGWDLALRSMKVGERAIVRVVDTDKLGYGTAGVPPLIQPNQQLEFDITLLDCQSPTLNIDFDSIATLDNTPVRFLVFFCVCFMFARLDDGSVSKHRFIATQISTPHLTPIICVCCASLFYVTPCVPALRMVIPLLIPTTTTTTENCIRNCSCIRTTSSDQGGSRCCYSQQGRS